MQANGAEMLRLACILATKDGVSVIATLHDALMVETNEGDVDHAIHAAQNAMYRASDIVLSGFPLRSDVHVTRFPNRFEDERGTSMWKWLMESLVDIERSAATKL
jgi:hypothetical protein